MHRWNRTVLEWDFRACSEIETTLPVSCYKGKIEKGKFQRLYSIRAVSLPERLGKIEVALYPSVHLSNHAGEHHILKRLGNLGNEIPQVTVYRGTWGDGAWPPLIIKFKMGEGESFCDTAITLVKKILERAGVQDRDNYWLGHFTHDQASFVRFENSWVSFVRWLRMEHRLPMDYVLDDKNIPLVEGRDLA